MKQRQSGEHRFHDRAGSDRDRADPSANSIEPRRTAPHTAPTAAARRARESRRGGSLLPTRSRSLRPRAPAWHPRPAHRGRDRRIPRGKPGRGNRLPIPVARRASPGAATTDSHQQPGAPSAQPNSAPQCAHCLRRESNGRSRCSTISTGSAASHHACASSLLTASATALRNRTIRGPHSEAIESFTGTTAPLLTAAIVVPAGSRCHRFEGLAAADRVGENDQVRVARDDVLGRELWVGARAAGLVGDVRAARAACTSAR